MPAPSVPGYERFFVAVDPVIFTISGSELKVLLSRREKEPFKGAFELPGGLVRPGETAEETLARKLKDVLLVEGIFFTQFFTFTDPGRDPRGRAVSIGFIALVGEHKIPSAGSSRSASPSVSSDSPVSSDSALGWFPIDALPSLAFDHKVIVGKAREFLKADLGSQVVRHFLPDFFALNRLQSVHEVITGEKIDNRNFRRKMLASGVVEETRKVEENVSHRPALLYKFKA